MTVIGDPLVSDRLDGEYGKSVLVGRQEEGEEDECGRKGEEAD